MKPQHLVSVVLVATAALAAWWAGPAAAQGRGATRDIPYATNFAITVGQGNGSVGLFSPDPVPANKRLVIEFVSVTAIGQAGEKPSLFLNDLVSGAGRLYWIALAPDPAGGPNVYRGSQLVKLYHDGDGASGPGASCGRNPSSFTTTMMCSVTISGYLIDK